MSIGVVKTFLRENEDLLRDPRHCVGIWYDAAEDQTYIDVSVTLSDETEAVRLGQQYNQRDIYDFTRREVIDTGGTGATQDDLPPVGQRLPPLGR